MNCPNCGTPLPDGTVVCPHCGARVGDRQPAPETGPDVGPDADGSAAQAQFAPGFDAAAAGEDEALFSLDVDELIEGMAEENAIIFADDEPEVAGTPAPSAAAVGRQPLDEDAAVFGLGDDASEEDEESWIPDDLWNSIAAGEGARGLKRQPSLFERFADALDDFAHARVFGVPVVAIIVVLLLVLLLGVGAFAFLSGSGGDGAEQEAAVDVEAAEVGDEAEDADDAEGEDAEEAEAESDADAAEAEADEAETDEADEEEADEDEADAEEDAEDAEEEEADEEEEAEDVAASFSAAELYEALSAYDFDAVDDSSSAYLVFWLDSEGSITGQYHDESALSSGVVYDSTFSGTIADAAQESEFVYSITIESVTIEGESFTEDGVQYLVPDTVGISSSDTLEVYAPGATVSDLPKAVRQALKEVDGASDDGVLAVYVMYRSGDDAVVFVGSAA